jgi:N-methylhydantoinase A
MRYGEQTFEIQVPLDGVDFSGGPRGASADGRASNLMEQIVERFHRRHEELYTYSAPGQDVVLVNARVAVIGRLRELPAERAAATAGSGGVTRRRRVYLGRWIDVPVLDMAALSPGDEIKGAAIVESPTTTVLIRAGERATITPQGWLDIRL